MASSHQRGKWESTPTSPELQRNPHLVLTWRSGFPLGSNSPSYLVSERPWEQSIVVSFHYDEEQGHVGSLPCPIPVEIHSQTDLVAIPGSVESWKAALCISKASLEKRTQSAFCLMGKDCIMCFAVIEMRTDRSAHPWDYKPWKFSSWNPLVPHTSVKVTCYQQHQLILPNQFTSHMGNKCHRKPLSTVGHQAVD